MLIFQCLSHRVIGACLSVHNILGPGLLESAYEGALVIEFKRLGIPVVQQKIFSVYYKGEMAGAYIADVVVDNSIILELKSVSQLKPVMEAQLLNYLKISGLRVGYLVNFHNSRLSWKRFVV